MTDRLQKELELLRRFYPSAEHLEVGQVVWIKIPSYPVPPEHWNRDRTTVCFEVNTTTYPQAPYGFYVETGMRLKNGAMPDRYAESVTTPFPGNWGKFSWQAENWRATTDVASGSNLASFARSFSERFKEAV